MTDDASQVPLASREDPEDLFQGLGITLPSHLNTYRRRWLSLTVVAVSGAFAGGPLAGWPTLEPLLISQGVWAGPDQVQKLSSVFSVAQGAGVAALGVSGVLYDALGARFLGTAGALGVAASLLVMLLAIQVPSLNNLLWVAYPAAMVFGSANSYDGYAWLWMLPHDQNTVAAVVGAIQCASDSLCVLAVLLHDYFGVQLTYYFCGSAAMSIIAAVLAWVLVPSHEEMGRISRASSKLVAGTKAVGYGSTFSSSAVSDDLEQSRPCCQALSSCWSALKACFNLCLYVHPTISTLFILWVLAQYMVTMYPLFELYPLYDYLMGASRATELVNIFGGLCPAVSCISLILSGMFVDRFGFVQIIAWISLATVFNAVLYDIPTVTGEVVGQVFLSWLLNVSYVYLPRFCVMYAPPELFGTLLGVIYGLQGVLQVLLTRVGAWLGGAIASYLYHEKTSRASLILVTIDIWTVLTVLFACALLFWWSHHPPPVPGSITMVHVRRATSYVLLDTDEGKGVLSA